MSRWNPEFHFFYCGKCHEAQILKVPKHLHPVCNSHHQLFNTGTAKSVCWNDLPIFHLVYPNLWPLPFRSFLTSNNWEWLQSILGLVTKIFVKYLLLVFLVSHFYSTLSNIDKRVVLFTLSIINKGLLYITFKFRGGGTWSPGVLGLPNNLEIHLPQPPKPPSLKLELFLVESRTPQKIFRSAATAHKCLIFHWDGLNSPGLCRQGQLASGK